MKNYEKPSISVIELQLKENIAALPTTVFKGSSRASALENKNAVTMALSLAGTGLEDSDFTDS